MQNLSTQTRSKSEFVSARVESTFTYDKKSGELTYKKATGKMKKGDHAGYIDMFADSFKFKVQIDGRKLYATHIIGFLVNGKWPNQVSHVDGDNTNLKFSNLKFK